MLLSTFQPRGRTGTSNDEVYACAPCAFAKGAILLEHATARKRWTSDFCSITTASKQSNSRRNGKGTSNAFSLVGASPLLLVAFILILALQPMHCDARTWTNIIDMKHADRGDAYRWMRISERDPFLAEGETSAPTESPLWDDGDIVDATEPTWPIIDDAPGETVSQPTLEPIDLLPDETLTDTPTLHPAESALVIPTPSPTDRPVDRSMDVDGNGGCPDNEYLMGLFMYDKGGDGWDDTKMAIIYEDFYTKQFAYKGGLKDGFSNFEYICLRADVCYHTIIEGSIWLNEISWEIRPVVLGKEGVFKWAVAKGRAPVDCDFFFGDQRNPACETTCLSWEEQTPTLKPVQRPVTETPTTPPTRQPTLRPTEGATIEPTLSDDFADRRFLRN